MLQLPEAEETAPTGQHIEILIPNVPQHLRIEVIHEQTTQTHEITPTQEHNELQPTITAVQEPILHVLKAEVIIPALDLGLIPVTVNLIPDLLPVEAHQGHLAALDLQAHRVEVLREVDIDKLL